MTAAAQRRKGWCPGALRPMPAKDGLLVRLRISGGALSAASARRLAHAARDHGNGLFDLSLRGNLQLRGVSARSLPVLTKVLDDLGLLDPNESAEAIRNVLVSPLAGIESPIDVRPIAKALESALVEAADLHELPGKFGFLVDHGGALSLGSIPADVRFDYDADRKAFAVRIGGSASDAAFLRHCAPEQVADAALRLARAFLRLGSSVSEPPRRMRELVQLCGPAPIAEAARLRLEEPPRPTATAEPSPVGPFELGNGIFCFGVGAAFGRFDAAMLETIAEAAEIFAKGEIRLTPWRAMLLPFVDATQIEALRTLFSGPGFIIDRANPRLAIAACGGAVACAQGSTPTHAHALALAPLARQLQENGVALHVSGCAKQCARQAPTPYALVAEAGRYDLLVQGATMTRGLSFGEAQRMLDAIRQQTRSIPEPEYS